MKILLDGSRLYVECRHCPGMPLDPKHLFSCPSIVVAFFKIGNDCSMDILHSDRAMDVAMAVIHVTIFNITSNGQSQSALDEVEIDQAKEESAEILDINHDSKSEFEKRDGHETFELKEKFSNAT
ncbi:RNase H domain-containing protein [Trichonephila clavipes]|nr:RNase H domain-containing protein [Trichonephila clavipes]